MKNIRFFLSKHFHVLVVKFSVYFNRHVFVMKFLSFRLDAFQKASYEQTGTHDLKKLSLADLTENLSSVSIPLNPFKPSVPFKEHWQTV